MADNVEDSIEAGKQYKIRDSCNNCSAMKIRCGKERAKCSRCAQKGLDCDYSISRRTGKRSQPPTGADNNNNNNNNGNGNGCQDGVHPPTPQTSVPTSLSMQLGDDTHCMTAGFASFGQMEQQSTLQDDISWMLTPTNSIPNDGSLGYYDMAVSDTPMSNSLVQASTMDDGNPSARKRARLSSAPIAPVSDLDILFEHNPPDHKSRSSKPVEWRRSSSTTSIFPSSSTSSYTSLRQDTHDCAFVALQVVADLHVASQGCLTAANNSLARTQQRSSAGEIRLADAILQCNSEALQRLDKILDCRCSYEQGVLVPVYLALHKAISWYAAIVGSADKSQSAQADRIATKPIFMGNYCLDAATQRMVRAQVVRKQLKDHVEPLVNRLASWAEEDQASSGSTSLSTSSSPRSSSLSLSSLSSDPGIDIVKYYHQALQDRLSKIISTLDNIK